MPAADVAAALRARQSFILTSHARPDGDAVGSQLALAFALRTLGKTVRVLEPGQMVTMEFDGERLNIEVDATKKIVAVRCG